MVVSLTALAGFSAPLQTFAPLPSPSATVNLASLGEDDEFLVTILDGYVTVYLSDKPLEPLEITEIRAETLRLGDQEILRRGVKLQGAESLSVFLEDFGP